MIKNKIKTRNVFAKPIEAKSKKREVFANVYSL